MVPYPWPFYSTTTSNMHITSTRSKYKAKTTSSSTAAVSAIKIQTLDHQSGKQGIERHTHMLFNAWPTTTHGMVAYKR